MKVVFLSVGEAFDENYANNSHIIESDTKLLLDCGSSVPQHLWKYCPNAEFLDAIFISHFHADHYFGVPSLIVRMREEKRTRPLTIISSDSQKVKEILEMGYPGLLAGLTFELNFKQVTAKDTYKLNELILTFAPSEHSVPDLAIRVSDKKNSVCYSGDGNFTQRSQELYKDCDLLIHETYMYDEKMQFHANILDTVSMAQRAGVKKLALTHLQRDLRKDPPKEYFIPSPGEKIILSTKMSQDNFE